MRIVLQRVSKASVVVDREEVASIGRGLLLLVGVETADSEAQAVELAEKIRYLRVFEDEAGKMNLDASEVGGEVLVVSQFTLAASTRKGRRPSFNHAASPERAIEILECFVARLRDRGLVVSEGRFGAKMAVALVNDGPVTLWLEAPSDG